LTLATVLVPTHDHGPTLLRSVGSALAQTVEDLEVFVVGDGVPDVTREVMAQLTAADERVRFFDNPKGPRHGEIHRHAALQQAGGEVVCYLSDDDLWLPEHVEHLRALLADADFAHAFPLWIDTEGRPHPWLVDLERPLYRDLLLGGQNRIPFSCGGHTLELYRRLPAGWRTTPGGTFTDLYMWAQILSVPGCRAVSGSQPTVLHFPSPARHEWSVDERLAELDSWSRRLADPGLRFELFDRLAEGLAAEAQALEESVEGLAADARAVEEYVASLRDQLANVERDRELLSGRLGRLDAEKRALEDEHAQLWRRLDDLDAEMRAVDEERARLSALLDELSSSVTWRLRARLVGLPGVGAVIRWAARALARPAAPAGADSPRPARTLERSAQAKGSPARDRPNDTRARRSGPSTR
jgi:GalNAc5-diNAcBac-PP-undecaprenol beta-1,3-glucosyltransferase